MSLHKVGSNAEDNLEDSLQLAATLEVVEQLKLTNMYLAEMLGCTFTKSDIEEE